MYAYCNNNPVIHADLSGQLLTLAGITGFIFKALSSVFKNVQLRTHVTTPSIMLDGGILLGEVGFSSTVTNEANSAGTLYSFNDAGNDEVRNGIGVNFGEWLGAEAGFNNKGNLFTDVQITPYTHVEGTIGLGGVGITTGFIKENISYDFTARIGLGSIAVFIVPKVIVFALA